ncbi:HET-domain-containing protein, partial [Lentithecium fluviatile CBS 122367]
MSDNNGLLPHRILDLGVDETSPIVLKETVEGEREQYACLSHSWGGHQPLQTTTATLEERKKGIQWKDLPRTFQDAVSFTRRLNLRYIWIDSLCIIQDDGDDWAAESALMADIYRNATITVSAAASKGPHDGLFVSTQPQHQGTKLTPVFVEPPNPLPSFYTHRGWVLQERLLSPRVIHFGTYELVWECMQASNCECDRNFHPAALSNLPLPFTANAWRKVVQDFCGLTLTYAKDAFPAVSGSAKIVKQSLEERGVEAKYIAGMWDCWFVEDCLWSVTAPAVRPDEWRAPTFSWASV